MVGTVSRRVAVTGGAERGCGEAAAALKSPLPVGVTAGQGASGAGGGWRCAGGRDPHRAPPGWGGRRGTPGLRFGRAPRRARPRAGGDGERDRGESEVAPFGEKRPPRRLQPHPSAGPGRGTRLPHPVAADAAGGGCPRSL